MARIRQIFELPLSLEHVRPTVWRRILVPDDCTLARLHKVIQAVMNWQDYHLHEFTVKSQAYGDPEVDEEAGLLMIAPFAFETWVSRLVTESSMSTISVTTGIMYWSWKTRCRRPRKRFIPCVWAANAPPLLRM
jgi:Plasmid pRiA4b ORF-3-like protein